MAVWGYARVSTEDQNLGLQVTALAKAGVSPRHIVREKASGRADRRAEAVRMHVQEGKSIGQIAALFGCGRTVVHRAIHGA